MITAEIIADSVHPEGPRLTTFVLTYPRFIHAEFMTHRMFSRNASSSRAIPVAKQIQMVIDNPAIPIAFLKNKAGMQGGEALDNQDDAVKIWLHGRDRAVEVARAFAEIDVHKQYANRVLEPWAHITVVCSATDWANFFALRMHPAAMPEIHTLAGKMHAAMNASTPSLIGYGNWHLPFVTDREIGTDKDWNISVRMSVARCARVSYLNHEGKAPTFEEDMKLYDRLMGAHPIHASPAEHQATPMERHPLEGMAYYGNFRGWMQHRKLLTNENITEFTK